MFTNLHYTAALACLSFLGMGLSAQTTCCSPTDAFAALGNDHTFRAGHEEPQAFILQDGRGSMIRFETTDSDSANAYLIPSLKRSDKWLFVFHEWWGLNDQVKAEAELLAEALGEVNVICLDLYDGKVTNLRDSAAAYMQQANEERIRHIVSGARQYAGFRSRIATIGWCFGGGWSMQSALSLGQQAAACVIYYGMPENDPVKLKKLACPVLGIFAEQDQWINAEVVENFSKEMVGLRLDHEVLVFPADHAFANPSNPNFNKKAKKDADKAALEFLKASLMAK